MGKLGFDKGTGKAPADTSVAHDHVPSRAYDVANPSEKLMNIVGGGFFNEPRYYSDGTSTDDGLNEQANDVLEAIRGVIASETPEDLFVIASWARDPEKGLKLRTTPQIMLTLAAADKRTQPFVRKYAPNIIRRADEVRQVFAAFRHLFQNTDKVQLGKAKPFRGHRGALPHALRKALQEALSTTSLYELMKYNSEERPTLKDVLLMVGGRKPAEGKTGYPLPKAVFEYFVNGKVTQDAPPMIKARERFNALPATALLEVNAEFLKEAGLTWENVTSKFGTSPAVWHLCIPLMGEMALTRNLRNFEEAPISKEDWDIVYSKVGKITDTVQLPFRFFAAAKATKSTEAHTLIAMQLDQACNNVPDLTGTTVVLVDNSGSAVSARVSDKSAMHVSDAGNTLAAIVAKKMGRRAIVGAFGDSLVWVPFNQADSCLTIKAKIDALAQTEERSKHGALALPQYKHGIGVGQSTETGLWWAIDDLTKKKTKVDRFILLSDLCCYTQDEHNCGHGAGLAAQFGPGANMQTMFDRYRKQVNNEAYVYSVNLAGYSQSQVKPGKGNTHLLSGWSEQIFSIMRDIEGAEAPKSAAAIPEALPTLQVLRERYRK